MFKQYFTQALAQLRQHPLISMITVVGTALSIFLIMLVVMMQQVQVAPFSPESYRDRMLHVRYMSIEHESWKGGNSNGPMSAQSGKELYQSLSTPEAATIYTCMTFSTPVSLPGTPTVATDLRETDDVYWRVFDFRFIDGKPYDQATFDAGRPVAVITRSIARALFNTDEGVVGKEFLLNHAPYTVVGVVQDVSTLATKAYGQVWVPFTSTNMVNNVWNDGHMGMMSCTILAKDKDDLDAIREEANRKLTEYNSIIGQNGWNIIHRNRPYDQETDALAYGANWEPDVNAERRSRYTTFLILLLVPAINLSSMTQSRLRQRVSEIGVRRAFGSTRTEIMGQILMENLIVTLIAGLIGLFISLGFAWLGADMLFAQSYSATVNAPTVNATMLLQPSTFVSALVFCFVLNLLSTGFPAWRASRIGIVNAIGGRLS